ncbi:MAG TPA: NUDIX domain-containing protein [Ktedonobacteraceae bacterium]|nr:NUDIX domain-containing protein [Ktedonobacteraceae bacterium]
MSKIQDYLATNPPIRETVIGYLIRGNEVLLGIRTRVSNDLGHHVIAGIGGGVEAGETLEEALKREIHEEIEVDITEYQKVGRVVNLSPHRPAWNMRVMIYLVAAFEGEPKKTVDIDPRWYLKAELPLPEMWSDNQITAPLALAGKRIAGSFLYSANGQIAEQWLTELTADEAIPEIIGQL